MTEKHSLVLRVRRFKRLLEFFGYTLFDPIGLIGQPVRPERARVALVHVELLGDAFLWLPYAQALVQSAAREGRSAVIVCEQAVRDVFSTALPGCEIFSFSRRSFLRSPRARWRTLRALRELRIGQTIHCSHPRDGGVQDATVRALGAPTIGFAAVFADRPAIDRWLNDKLYARLIQTAPQNHIQMQQQTLLQALGMERCPVEPPYWPLRSTAPMDTPYWVLAPGASRVFRQWPTERFAAVAEHVKRQRPDWRCVIVGTAAERPLAAIVAARLGDAALDLTGKTSVPELIDWIAHARLVLGNDSAAGHIAAAMGAPAVVVVGGGHWGRCYPYPPDAPVRRLPVAVGHPMPCYGCDWYCVHSTRTDQAFPCIEGVTVEAVTRAVDAVFNAPSTSALLAPNHAPACKAGVQRQ